MDSLSMVASAVAGVLIGLSLVFSVFGFFLAEWQTAYERSWLVSAFVGGLFGVLAWLVLVITLWGHEESPNFLVGTTLIGSWLFGIVISRIVFYRR